MFVGLPCFTHINHSSPVAILGDAHIPPRGHTLEARDPVDQSHVLTFLQDNLLLSARADNGARLRSDSELLNFFLKQLRTENRVLSCSFTWPMLNRDNKIDPRSLDHLDHYP